MPYAHATPPSLYVRQLLVQDDVNANATYLVQIEKLHEIHQRDTAHVTDGQGKLNAAPLPQSHLSMSKPSPSGATAGGEPGDLSIDTLVSWQSFSGLPARLTQNDVTGVSERTDASTWEEGVLHRALPEGDAGCFRCEASTVHHPERDSSEDQEALDS